MNAFSGTLFDPSGVDSLDPLCPVVSQSASDELTGQASDEQSIDEWIKTLSRLTKLGVSVRDIESCRRHAYQNGSTTTVELITNGFLDEITYYRALAEELDIDFMETVDPNLLIVPPGHSLVTLRTVGHIKTLLHGGNSTLLLAPDDNQLTVLIKNLLRYPGLRRSVCLTAPSRLNQALIERMTFDNLEQVVFRLKNTAPNFSASQVATGPQGILLGVLLTWLPYCAWWWPWESLLWCHVLASSIFAASVLMRVRAAGRFFPPLANQYPPADGPYPIYSVIVAVYHESSVIPQLINQLMALSWPSSRLEILIACEKSDTATINALRDKVDPSRVQIIVAPKLGPQTKPRALSLALEAARGEFVVIYDAEDRPHPEQLMEAYQRFQQEPTSTACLQAPLVVTNSSNGFLARMFSFEYAALFGALLPYLATSGRFIPLGGTSNHFRRSALIHAGGWDPFNVTEDADLGTRLCRLGYRCGMITQPTFEDAPTRLVQWRPQRVRWFKGWLQTWLVHTRRPQTLLNDLGTKDFLRFHLLTMGMFLSALVYPSILAVIVWSLYILLSSTFLGMSALTMCLFVVDFCNIILGHLVFSSLGGKVEQSRGNKTSLFFVLYLPVYWTLLSIAAWGALWELFRKPHHWNKTEHFPTAARDRA